MPPRKLYFENTRVGDEIPAMAKAPIDRVQLARYAGATGDYNPLSVDEAYARSLGMPSVIAPATLGQGFLGQLVSDWARGAQVRRFAVKFVRMVWPGDTLVCRGRVSDRHGQDGRYFIELDVWAENQKGELVLRGAVTLQVFYSAEDENRFKAGQAPLVVNVPRESILVTPPNPPPLRAATRPAAPARPSAARGKPAGKKPTGKRVVKTPAPRKAARKLVKQPARRPAPKGGKRKAAKHKRR